MSRSKRVYTCAHDCSPTRSCRGEEEEEEDEAEEVEEVGGEDEKKKTERREKKSLFTPRTRP